MVFGDSNSFRPEQSETSWPKLLKDKDPHHLNVFNESYDGRTTRYDLGERNGLSVIGKKLTAQTPLDYVFVMLGTNDVKSKYGPPSTTEIVDGMRQILDIIETRGFGAKPILLTLPPIGNVISGDLAGAQFRIPPVVAEYRLLSINLDIRLIDIHSILDIRTDLESDMIHL
ncbi:GDSL-type esterase/lipase family protein, partial [bacterium]|nr:GDSL-type esterase/lipase family protein [bacterium]